MTIAYQVDCNICGYRLETNGRYLKNAHTLITAGGVANPWSIVHTSQLVQDSPVHVCRTCLDGIRKISDYELEK